MPGMRPLLHPFRRPLAVVAGLSLMVNLLLLTPAIFMLQVFDRVLSSQSGDTLLVLLLGTAIALGLMLMLDYLRSRLQGLVGTMVGDALSPVVAQIVVAQGARRLGRPPTEALRDIAALRGLFSSQGLLALFDAPWALIFVAVIWLAHPQLGLAALAAALLMLALALVNDRLTRRDIERVTHASATATRYLEASLANAEVAQALGMTGALISRWQTKSGEVAALQKPIARKSVAMAALTRAVRQSVQVFVLGLGAWLVIHGEASAGIMIATTTLLGRALAPVEQVVGSWRVLAEGRAALRRLTQLLAEADAQPERMPLPAPQGQLTAQGLVFRVPKSDRLILSGVSLQLEPGEVLAIIGASAAGKSTLVRLLSGVWKPSAGVVRLDQADLAQWPREDLGPHIGYVPQDVELFPGTVAENIARLGPVDADQVVQAAQRAHVHDMILGLPEGYDTLIDAAGAALSPGQRQRIALARALYGSPRLILLDEPNSNLDAAGEAALAATIRKLRGHSTVVVVTHRNALVQHVDKIMVLDAGRVQNLGPTADVLKALQSQAAQAAQVAPATPAAHPAPGESSPAAGRVVALPHADPLASRHGRKGDA